MSIADSKVNIYVPGYIYEMLEQDVRMFEVYKHDGVHVNMNRFLNMLIQGYYDTYTNENNNTRKEIITALQKLSFTDREKEEITANIMEVVIRPAGKRGGKGSKSVSLKPTGNTEDIVQNISNEFVSQYFRRMFISYCRKPFSQREQIIFRDNYNLLSECCMAHQPFFSQRCGTLRRFMKYFPLPSVLGWRKCSITCSVRKKTEKRSVWKPGHMHFDAFDT